MMGELGLKNFVVKNSNCETPLTVYAELCICQVSNVSQKPFLLWNAFKTFVFEKEEKSSYSIIFTFKVLFNLIKP